MTEASEDRQKPLIGYCQRSLRQPAGMKFRATFSHRQHPFALHQLLYETVYADFDRAKIWTATRMVSH